MSMKITKRILYGNEATPLKKMIGPNSHNWTLFVRAFEEDDLDVYNMIETVIFHLHESFPNSHRRVVSPPYTVTENGWGEFEALIEIVFKQNLGSITLKHFIVLFNQDKVKKSVVSHVCFDQIIIVNPPEEFVKLTLAPIAPEWKATLKSTSGFQDEKDALKKVQSKLQTELQNLEKEYHTLLSSACKKTNLLTE
ncbi:yeats domain, putative [Entamoeba invadens IP1]|uniref:Yeats domain, putative n=1 Tax=Entamoeba invadens IP1 TaxID=370355 RepID=A0A0A1UDZ2_ENTIV|nr:yeats domain, putative [Entamoeba invadens IP1]ELP94826.1 yeats domain, putative [Entamoeba invadens IP1]|eukprot:XP_004261597.1 yeats domain, putative [Entamoeba invadens IP1]